MKLEKGTEVISKKSGRIGIIVSGPDSWAKYVVQYPEADDGSVPAPIRQAYYQFEVKAAVEKAKDAEAAKAEAEAVWQDDLAAGFGMKWRVSRSWKVISAKPNETFWAYWKSDRQNEIRAMGFRVSKGVDYYVELDTAGDEYQRTHVQFGERVIAIDMVEEVFGVESQPEPEPEGDPLRHLSADTLKYEEVGETDDDEFRQIHGYEEDDGTYGRI